MLTQIDVKDTLNKKIGANFRPYLILGACNPKLAYEALTLEDKIGTMLSLQRRGSAARRRQARSRFRRSIPWVDGGDREPEAQRRGGPGARSAQAGRRRDRLSATGADRKEFHRALTDDTLIEGPLYEKPKKVYPQSVHGQFRRIKWTILCVTLGIYYLLPFIRWNRGPGLPRQAALVDLPHRRFYFLLHRAVAAGGL